MARTQTYTYTLPSGAVVYIENEEPDARGAREVSAKDAEQGLPFLDVIRPIGEVAELVFESVKSKIINPDKITLEFGATLKGGINLYIVSGTTDATFKVSLAWDRK
jgi:hypothetical protein